MEQAPKVVQNSRGKHERKKKKEKRKKDGYKISRHWRISRCMSHPEQRLMLLVLVQ